MTSDEDEIENRIRNCRLFRRLSDAELERVVSCAERMVLEDDEVIYREGERSPSFFLIAGGSVQITRETTFSPAPATHVTENGVIGMISALAQHPRTATAKPGSEGDTKIIRIGVEELLDKCKETPELTRKLYRAALQLAATRLDNSRDVIHALLR